MRFRRVGLRSGLGGPDGIEGKGLWPDDSALAWNGERDDGSAGAAGVEAVGEAVTAAEEDFDDGVVDEDMQAGLGGKGFGELDLDFVDPDGEGILIFVGADLEEGAGGVGDGVVGGFPGVRGLKDAAELLAGVG